MSSFSQPVCSVAEWVPHSGDWSASAARGDSFHLVVFFMRWSSTHGGLASGSSGSQASRFGLLVYVQVTSDSLPRSSPGVRSNLWFLV